MWVTTSWTDGMHVSLSVCISAAVWTVCLFVSLSICHCFMNSLSVCQFFFLTAVFWTVCLFVGLLNCLYVNLSICRCFLKSLPPCRFVNLSLFYKQFVSLSVCQSAAVFWTFRLFVGLSNCLFVSSQSAAVFWTVCIFVGLSICSCSGQFVYMPVCQSASVL